MTSEAKAHFGGPPFPERPMTLFPLNAGEDNLMLDWTGSMTLPRAIHGHRAWWYKAGRLISPDMPKELPLIRPGMILESDQGLEFPARSEQCFRVETAVLATRVFFSESVVEVESLLWRGCFVRRVRILHAAAGVRLAFTLNDRRIWKYGPEYTPSSPWEYGADGETAWASLSHHPEGGPGKGGDPVGGFDGTCRCLAWKEGGGFGSAKAGFKCPRFVEGDASAVSFGDVRMGDVYVCGVALLDSLSPCGDGHVQATKNVLKELRASGFETVRDEVAADWGAFRGRSRIHIKGVPEANHFFELSRYAIRSAQHSAGSIPCASDLSDLGSAAFWDTWGPGGALMRLNHPEEGKRLGLFWTQCLPRARKQAEWLGAEGARLPWRCAPVPAPGTCHQFPQPQYHNIGVALQEVWEAYAYTGDKDFLREAYPLLEESSRFLRGWLLSDEDGGSVRAVGSLDENPMPRENDTWTAASALRAIRIHEAAAGVLGERLPEEVSDARRCLENVLRANTTEDGLLAYPGASKRNLGAVLPYRMHPELPGFDATFAAYERDSREVEGLGLGPYTHARARIFPWIQAKAAAVLAAQRKPGIWRDYLAPLLRHTDCWGGSPELWLHHREFSMSWYLGSHGFYLLTLAELIAAGDPSGGFDFLWGADPEWEEVEFENLCLPGGLLAEGCWAYGETRKLALKNDGPEVLRQIPYRIGPGGAASETAVVDELAPGERVELR